METFYMQQFYFFMWNIWNWKVTQKRRQNFNVAEFARIEPRIIAIVEMLTQVYLEA